MNGWDLVVEMQKGNPYPETSVRIKPKQTPLSDNNESVDLWLKSQPKPIESFTEYDYDFVKKQLKSYLDPTSVAEETPPAQESDKKVEDKLPESLGQQKTDFTLETATAGNKDTVSKFDDLFNE